LKTGPGATLAMMEMIAVLATLPRHVRFPTVEGAGGECAK
jgi:cytochrome P450